MAPAVSVILPTYQRRELVKRAVASALNQTYRDFELIVVDDGSTDGTREALEPVSDRLRYLWQENRGPSAARNAGIKVARGSIFAFLDSDDLWLPDHLESAVAALGEQPSAVLATTCPGRPPFGPQRTEPSRLVDPLPRLFTDHFVSWIPCVVVRREALVAIGGFDEQVRAGEHHDAYLRLALLGPFATVRRRTVVRREAPNSLHQKSRVNGDYLRGFERTARSLAREVEARGGRRELQQTVRGRLEFARALRALRDGDEAEVREALTLACALHPPFSHAPEWVEGRLRFNSGASARRQRARELATAASLWPEQATDTALHLRAHAIALALRTGELGRAGALLRGWRLRPTPGFACRAVPRVVRRARMRAYARRQRMRASRLVASST
jgi:glycosyltransferase involved in cell wall biosynthesis